MNDGKCGVVPNEAFSPFQEYVLWLRTRYLLRSPCKSVEIHILNRRKNFFGKAFFFKERFAGVAELGKGAGLRTLSRRSPRVQITPPAWLFIYPNIFFALLLSLPLFSSPSLSPSSPLPFSRAHLIKAN